MRPPCRASRSSLTHLRLNPAYVQARQRIRHLIRELPGVGDLAYSGVHGLTSALREVVTPHTFFEALGIRYAGPIDGHDIAGVEQALTNASEWHGPIVVHVLTQKGRGYAPAEDDDIQRLHDFKVVTAPGDAGGLPGAGRRSARWAPSAPHWSTVGGTPAEAAELPVTTYTDAFTRSLLRQAEVDPRIVAITAAMPGPTGLLPFEARFPDRFVDVGIAEQHAVTAAAGMAMAGMRPVVAVYSTFFSRAFDQANLDVGLHRLPVVLVLDRAGITGDDGPSHHGVLDMALGPSIPGMTVFAPSNAPEVEVMLAQALTLDGPSMIRFPKTPAPWADPDAVGSGFEARQVRGRRRLGLPPGRGQDGGGGRRGGRTVAPEGIDLTVWDVRVVSDPDPRMVADAGRHGLVVTAEDGVRQGGAGMFLADAVRASCPRGVAPPVISSGDPPHLPGPGQARSDPGPTRTGRPGLARSVRDALGIGDAARRGALGGSRPGRGTWPGGGAHPAGPAGPVSHGTEPGPEALRPGPGGVCRPNGNVFY